MKTRILASGVASLLFSCAILAISRGVADLASVPARVSMASWEMQKRVGPTEDWRRAYDRLRLAHWLNPLSANYSADLGGLLEWQAWQHPPGSHGHAAYREYASQLYWEAINKRPSWGFGWARFAENRLLRGLEDPVYLYSLQKAMDLAPWEPVVQRKVAWMGIATWPSLPESMRSDVRSTVQRALKLSIFSDEVVRIAIQYDWTEELLPMLRTQRQRDVFDFVNRQINSR